MRSSALISGDVGAGRCFRGPSVSDESAVGNSGVAGLGGVREDPHDQIMATPRRERSVRVTGTPVRWTSVARAAQTREITYRGSFRLATGAFLVPRLLSSHQTNRVVEQVAEHRQAIAHAAGASREVDDQRLCANAGEPSGESGPREFRKGTHAERLGDAGCFLVENGARRFGRDVTGRESGASGGEYHVGPVSVCPVAEDSGYAAG